MSIVIYLHPLLLNLSFLSIHFSNECNPTILEHLLSSFNVFCSLVAPNARGRLCKLGEELVQPVLHAWIKSGPSVKVC